MKKHPYYDLSIVVPIISEDELSYLLKEYNSFLDLNGIEVILVIKKEKYVNQRLNELLSKYKFTNWLIYLCELDKVDYGMLINWGLHKSRNKYFTVLDPYVNINEDLLFEIRYLLDYYPGYFSSIRVNSIHHKRFLYYLVICSKNLLKNIGGYNCSNSISDINNNIFERLSMNAKDLKFPNLRVYSNRKLSQFRENNTHEGIENQPVNQSLNASFFKKLYDFSLPSKIKANNLLSFLNENGYEYELNNKIISNNFLCVSLISTYNEVDIPAIPGQ